MHAQQSTLPEAASARDQGTHAMSLHVTAAIQERFPGVRASCKSCFTGLPSCSARPVSMQLPGISSASITFDCHKPMMYLIL